jgi:hypothetical protein
MGSVPMHDFETWARIVEHAAADILTLAEQLAN